VHMKRNQTGRRTDCARYENCVTNNETSLRMRFVEGRCQELDVGQHDEESSTMTTHQLPPVAAFSASIPSTLAHHVRNKALQFIIPSCCRKRRSRGPVDGVATTRGNAEQFSYIEVKGLCQLVFVAGFQFNIITNNANINPSPSWESEWEHKLFFFSWKKHLQISCFRCCFDIGAFPVSNQGTVL
jgi:hypothetical protein